MSAELALPAGLERIAGVDEAGRGPRAGPVVVAAVILPEQHGLAGLDDSKKLSEADRESLFEPIQARAMAFHIETVDVHAIEQRNILGATLWGMQRCVQAVTADYALIDGNRLPELPCPGQALVGGDGRVAAISAASVLAKVYRDRLMTRLHERYPAYGFHRHRGYGTPEHLQRLEQHGPCPEHRRGFAPVRRLLEPGLFSD